MPNEMGKILRMLARAQHIYIIGDGGSAAMADHFACDLLKNCKLPAISLCANTAVITALGNDYGFDEIYSRQLDALFAPEDVLVIFTTSGLSPNLLRAALRAAGCGEVIAVSGNSGGKLKKSATVFYDLTADDQQACEDKMSVFCHEVMRAMR